MPNSLRVAGASPRKPSHKAALYQGARWPSGLYTNRSPLRDAASTRIEEKFYGPRGDAFLDGENLEVSQRLTLIRRPGSSVYNNQTWNSPDVFYEFRQFNASTEQIKVMVDQDDALYDGTGPDTKIAIWQKPSGSGQSYMQSIGNSLYWGDGVSKKKFLTTLQTRLPYSSSLTENPYNFTPFDLNSFIIDTNGDAQQLIETIIQLSGFYILNNTIVFSLATLSSSGFTLPKAYEFLEPGLEVYFSPSSEVAAVLGQTTEGVTLTIQNLSGSILTATVFFGGTGYTVGDMIDLAQTSPSGSMSGQVQVTSTGNSAGTGYITATNVPTTSTNGSGATLNVTASGGGLVSASVVLGGTGYVLGDLIYPIQSNGKKGFFKITGVTSGVITSVALATGVVTGVTLTAAGTGYVAAENVPTTGGTGSGLALDITDDELQFNCPVVYSGGSISSFTLDSPGTGYAVGDTLIPLQPSHPLATGALLSITGITGTVGSLSFTSGGPAVFPYTTGVPTYTTSGVGTGAAFNITSVSGGLITGISITSLGTGFQVGDLIYLTKGSATGAVLSVTAITVDAVASLIYISGGPAVNAYTVAAITSFTVAPPGGSGATFNVTSVNSGGQITGLSVTAAGTGFNVGDVLTLTQGSANTAQITVATLTGGAGTGIATFTITNPGTAGYFTATNGPTTSSGAGTGALIDITGVTSGSIDSGGWDLAFGGTGYTVGDLVFPTQGTASGAQFTVASVSNTGISTIAISVSGLVGYTVASGISTNTSGTGTGCTINITGVTNGQINSGGWALNAGGSGYKVGDLVYPVQGGASGAILQVTSISSSTGGVATFSVLSSGTGYVSEAGLSTGTSGAGTGATITIGVGNAFFRPFESITDIPNVYSGGFPISDSRLNSEVTWNDVGLTTIDGSALWINRGTSIDSGLVYNWGMPGGTTAPVVVVNNATGGWEANTYYNQWQFIIVVVSGQNYIQQIITSGKSGGSAPAWSTTPGQNTTDGTAVWVCLSNDGDTGLTWAASTKYSVGHIIEDTVSSVSCAFRLQPYTGVQTQGSSFPVYCWQCNAQSGADVGAAGEIPSGGGNTAMALDGTQPTSTATYVGTMNSLFLSAEGGSNPITTSSIAGDGTVSGSPVQLFPGSQNLSMVMQPSFVIPAAGIYTFTVTHMNSWFWGSGSGSLDIGVTQITIRGNVLTVKCNQQLTGVLSAGTSLTFSGLSAATFLNSQTVTVTSVSGFNFTATLTHSNYGPVLDSGTASTGANLVPTVISGPMNWNPPYDFSTGTPIKGYPIMAANYVASGTSVYTDIVQISYPSAGVYPNDIYQGVWYHSIPSYTQPTTSPVLPATRFSFSMIYTLPGGALNYNIIPQDIATSDSGSPPIFPAWPTTLSGLQAVPPPDYPSVTEDSGNYTWWNIGPVSTFQWNSDTNYTTDTFIVDQNSNMEIPYEAGISGTTEPSFSTTLFDLTPDLPNLVWMNNGPESASPVGTISTTQGGWKYVVALVNTLDNTVSNASKASVATGNFFEASGVFISGGLPSVPDPQADYVAIFRTDDGGATYFLIPPPASGNGNTEYTLPLADYLANGFVDTNPDSNLFTLFQAPISLQNSVPAKGAINLAFNYGRLFFSVANVVYWSSGPDTPVGNGYDACNPSNYAVFPSLVTRIVPLNIGTLIFTVSDIYIITGSGTANNPFDPQPYITKVGLLSYNALTINGSIIYFMTTDQQVMELNTRTGLSQIGFPIADQFLKSPWLSSTSYLTWHVNGDNDQCLFTADGSTGWFRMCPTAPPEQGALTWSLKANIVGGCKTVQSVETTPGNIQLLIGPKTTGPILYRDYNVNTDNGQVYPANFVMGSIVLAYPGQLAAVEFITTECLRVSNGLPISLGVRMGEVSGEFEDLVYWTNDPPQLPPTETLFSQRFYLSQTKKPAQCRHLQIYGEFGQTNSADELQTLTVYGGFQEED